MTTSETGQVTGTADKDYNLIWFTEKCRGRPARRCAGPGVGEDE
jgi:hypothetical protein